MERGRVKLKTTTNNSTPMELARLPKVIEEESPQELSMSSSLLVGAKTIAGIGIGLLAVIAGSVVVGVAAQTIMIPSLLAKMAGGVAGGGIGLSNGLKTAKKIK